MQINFSPVPQRPKADATRERLVWTFFVGAAIAQTAFIMALTVSSLAGGELGSTNLSGLPTAFTTLGVASGAIFFTWVAKRFGRTISFTSGFATGALGAFIAAAAIALRSFPILLLGMTLIGLGHSNAHLARYAAADLRPATRRANTIGLIVWAGTIGAVLGPKALDPSGAMAISLGFNNLVGPYLGAAALLLTGATIYAVFLRPNPSDLAVPEELSELDGPDISRTRSQLLSTAQTRLALVAMSFAQGIMSLVMVQTPLHLRNIGEGLGAIGSIMMVHTLGMFAIAPLTGYLVVRFGTRRIIFVGACTLVISCILSFIGAEPERTKLLLPALLLLGLGWNFSFVAGSTQIMNGLSFSERFTIQGVSDTITRLAGGVASIVSGLIVGVTSYSALSIMGSIASFVPLIALIIWRDRPTEISV